VLANPIKFSETPVERYGAVPALGEHTREVLGELLGYTDERIHYSKRLASSSSGVLAEIPVNRSSADGATDRVHRATGRPLRDAKWSRDMSMSRDHPVCRQLSRCLSGLAPGQRDPNSQVVRGRLDVRARVDYSHFRL